MAAPTVVAVGTVAADTANITPGIPAGTQANDILLMMIESSNQTVAAISGWSDITGSPVAQASGSLTMLTVRWKRAGSSESAPTVVNPGDHVLARIVGIRGCPASGNPWDAVAVAIGSGSGGSASFPAITTTVADTLVFHLICGGNSRSSTSYYSWSAPSLSSVTVQVGNGTTLGDGGTIGSASGVMSTAGSVSGSTVQEFTFHTNAMMSVAFAPDVPLGTTANAGQAAVSADGQSPNAAVVASAGVADVTAAAQSAIGVVPRLFTTQTPTSQTSEPNPGPTLGTVINVAVAGYVTHLYWYASSTPPSNASTLPFVLYDGDSQAELAREVPGSVSAGWNAVALSSPVAVTAGTRLVVSTRTADTYAYEPGLFASTATANGQLTAPATGVDSVGNGRFRTDLDAFPNAGSGAGHWYGHDIGFSLTAPSGTTANAGSAAVGADGQNAAATIAPSAGAAAVGADAYSPAPAFAVTATAGLAAVTSDGFNPVAAVSFTAAAGLADVAADAFNATTTLSATPTAGLADVGVDAYNPAAVTVPTVTANAGLADVTADAPAPVPTVAQPVGQAAVAADAFGATAITVPQVTANAGAADVGVDAPAPAVAVEQPTGLAAGAADAFNATAQTSSNVTPSAGVADVTADAYGPTLTLASTATAGQAAAVVDAFSATAVTVAAGLANAGVADVIVDAFGAAAQPALNVTAGPAAVIADGYGPTAVTDASAVAQAGVADVGADAIQPGALTAVITAADVAAVTANAYGATAVTAAATVADALVAQATADAFNTLILASVVVTAGVAEVGVVAYASPKKRRPGTFTVGSTRARYVTGSTRGLGV